MVVFVVHTSFSGDIVYSFLGAPTCGTSYRAADEADVFMHPLEQTWEVTQRAATLTGTTTCPGLTSDRPAPRVGACWSR